LKLLSFFVYFLDVFFCAGALVEKRLSLAHQNCLSLAHFDSSAIYMPAVVLTAGERYSLPGIKNNTAGAFGICAGDNMLSLANV
jgi:hypothetical protein